MLQEIQSQIAELYKLQQNQSNRSDTDVVDKTLVPEEEERNRRLREATKQLEYVLFT